LHSSRAAAAAPYRRPLHRSFSNGVDSRNQQEAEGMARTRLRLLRGAWVLYVSSCVACSPAWSQFVADGVFFAELNEMLTRELAEDGYSGVEVRVTPMRTEIIIRATRTQNVLGMCASTSPVPITAVNTSVTELFFFSRSRLGEKGRRIRELTSVVQKRFNFPEGGVELYAEKVNNRGLCAIAQAESLRYKLLGGLAVRRLCTYALHCTTLLC
jgi:ribosomal protein S3